MIEDLLVEELRDLLHAEGQLVKALPKMAKAVNSDLLRLAFETHFEETREHVNRLKQVFELLGAVAKPKPCKGMEGLLDEGNEAIEEGEEKDDVAADLAVIAAAQKVEHYEISGYGTRARWPDRPDGPMSHNFWRSRSRRKRTPTIS